MITIKEFYNLYNRNSPFNKSRRIGDIDARLFLRDLSLPPAYFFAKHGISANSVTVLFLLASLVGNIVFLFPSNIAILISILWYEIAQLLDCIDGQLARYYGTFSDEGRLMDHLFHEIIISSFILVYGVKLFIQDGNVIYLIIAAVGTYSFAFNVLWDDTFSKLYRRRPNVNQTIVKIYTRVVNPFIKEPRYILGSLFALGVIQSVISVNLFSIHFILLVGINFVEKIVYRVAYLYLNSSKGPRKAWKGWS